MNGGGVQVVVIAVALAAAIGGYLSRGRIRSLPVRRRVALGIGTGLGVVLAIGLLWSCRPEPAEPPPPEPPLRGLGFSPFRECQSPERGAFPSLDEIREDVDLISEMGDAVRTYSSLNGGTEAARYAYDAGLRVSAGAWLGPEETEEQRVANQAELDAVIALADEVPLESVIVGNEVRLRDDLTAERLAEHIEYVQHRVSDDTPVTTAEIAGVMTQPENHVVVDAVDYLMVHIYPYWDGVDVGDAAWYVADVYAETSAAVDKPVVIGETGWPSDGPVNGDAEPGHANAAFFLDEWTSVAAEEEIDYYYFAAFDEPWKQEGGVGPYWGIWDVNREPKYDVTGLLDDPGPVPPRPTASPAHGASSYGEGEPEPVDDSVLGHVIYETWPSPTEYVPSGLMGDHAGVTFDDCVPRGRNNDDDEGPPRLDRAIRVDYRPTESGLGWAGMYWQHPADNWGTDPAGGIDLRGFQTLTFSARGAQGGEKVEFFSGGIEGDPADPEAEALYPDSLAQQKTWITLTDSWEEYTIELGEGDLSSVIGAFGWSANLLWNPDGVTFFLDDIVIGADLFSPPPPPPRPLCADGHLIESVLIVYVLDGARLCANNSPVGKYEIGVNTSSGRTDWLSQEGDALRMDYPGGQLWGAVFLTVGDPIPPGGRPGQDLSRCQALLVDVRSDTPGASLEIGIKDSAMPDDGLEPKVRITPSYSWETHASALFYFDDVDLTSVYVIIEFTFAASDPRQTVYFSNVRLECSP